MNGLGEVIDWLAASPSHTALFTDFDGTLSPIVYRPEAARPLPGAAAVLRRLARRLRVVGVLSGRPAAWLAEQLELTGDGAVEVYGLHGVEHTSGGPIELAPGAAAWREAVARARDEALAAGIAGLQVEDKGFGLTLHWRQAADPSSVAPRATELGRRLAAETGLGTRPGKASVELVAPLGVDKGTVVRSWGETPGVERLAFFGDDVSDLPAFSAIDTLAVSSGLIGLKVAVSGREVPPDLIEAADLLLAGPEEALRLLQDLAERLEGGDP